MQPERQTVLMCYCSNTWNDIRVNDKKIQFFVNYPFEKYNSLNRGYARDGTAHKSQTSDAYWVAETMQQGLLLSASYSEFDNVFVRLIVPTNWANFFIWRLPKERK